MDDDNIPLSSASADMAGLLSRNDYGNILRGAVLSPSLRVDPYYSPVLANLSPLFKLPVDAVQRGRDHGLPTYNAAREVRHAVGRPVPVAHRWRANTAFRVGLGRDFLQDFRRTMLPGRWVARSGASPVAPLACEHSQDWPRSPAMFSETQEERLTRSPRSAAPFCVHRFPWLANLKGLEC